MPSAQPGNLLLQWHITDRCNLRCSHCYQDGYSDPGPEFDQLLRVLDQYQELIATLQSFAGRRVRGHINITGGEPFMRQDLLHLLREMRRRKTIWGILSNGTLIDKGGAAFLKGIGSRFVQVSIEGTAEHHDLIRGAGNHAKTLKTLQLLQRTGIKTLVSFTAHPGNYRDFPMVASVCRRLGVTRLWADRLIPMGSGGSGGNRTLSKEQSREFFSLMATAMADRAWAGLGRRVVSMHRALQFLATGGQPYRCSAGRNLLTVMPDGTVYPCRRMPISVGNLYTDRLSEIYFESEMLKQLREIGRVSTGCESCGHHNTCRGGLRCLAYAVTGDPFRADPGCWLAKN